MKRLISIYSALILTCFLGLRPPVKAQNFIVIGSEQAPITYIRGTGTNVGLFVGVDLPDPYLPSRAQKSGEIGVARSFRGEQLGPGPSVVGAQGFGKISVGSWPPLVPPSMRKLEPVHFTADNLTAARIVGNRDLSLSASMRQDDFRISPVSDFVYDTGGTYELLLPVLCLDQYLDVPPDTPVTDFVDSSLSSVVMQTYAGIYRFDEYTNEHILSKIWYKNDTLYYYVDSVTEAELQMIASSNLELDSASLSEPPVGMYSLSGAYLAPALAQWVIWAASDNQDEQSFLDGYNHILWEYSGSPPVPADSITALYYLCHLVFHMAHIDSLSSRFRGPEQSEAVDVPNLEPYAYIQMYPDSFEVQNSSGGIKFTAEHSFDADGAIESYSWECDIGSVSGHEIIRIEYAQKISDSTPVVLTVVDTSGAVSADTVYVPYSNGVIVDVGESVSGPAIPKTFELSQNYPNPFNASTIIPFSLSRADQVEVRILNVLGQEVRPLIRSRIGPGHHSVIWDGQDLDGNDAASGIYLYQIRSSSHVDTKKLVLLR